MKRMVAEIEATADAVRARLAEGIIPVAEMEDLNLSVSAEFAEVNRRVLYGMAALGRFFRDASGGVVGVADGCGAGAGREVHGGLAESA